MGMTLFRVGYLLISSSLNTSIKRSKIPTISSNRPLTIELILIDWFFISRTLTNESKFFKIDPYFCDRDIQALVMHPDCNFVGKRLLISVLLLYSMSELI